MWRDLARLPSLLQALLSATQEQNLLLRELVQAATGKPATTNRAPVDPASRPPTRIRTEKDVIIMTPAARAAFEREEAARQRQAGAPTPWQNPSILQPGARSGGAGLQDP